MSRERPASDPREVLGMLMLAFEGLEVPESLRSRLAGAPAAGATLFKAKNVRDPAQVRALTSSLRAVAGRPLLIAADQEGGQLIALGDATTPFPGNMALAAVDDVELTERVARATGMELAAMGVNVNYAPVCDVATNPASPGLGIRSFGDDPVTVARHVAATVRGLQSAGVAATAKHFPGKGGVGVDTHHVLGHVARTRAQFDAVELAPFRAAIDAGVRLVMSGHFAAPALTGSPDVPATLSADVMDSLLRRDLGFDGVTITDALDMRALAQGSAQIVDVITAVRAGVDLLLTMHDLDARDRIEAGLTQALRRGLVEPAAAARSRARVAALLAWLGSFAQPGIDVVGCAAHQALAREAAIRSITLVRDDAGILPLRLDAGARVVVIQPMPTNITPADTTADVPPLLAVAVARRHATVESIVLEDPVDRDLGALVSRIAGAALVVLGTDAASLRPAHAALATALLSAGVPVVTVALRTPFDLAAYPEAATHVCAYGVLEPTCEALAATLFGEAPFAGHLPAAIPGLYPAGHGLVRAAR